MRNAKAIWAHACCMRSRPRRALPFSPAAMRPCITAQDWRDCAGTLESHDATFLPAEDGGYALVGLREPRGEIFHAMTWSHPGVMEDTRARMRAAHMTWREVRTIWDVDEEEDLAALER